MKLLWKKNYIKLPEKIKLQLSKISNDKIIICSIKEITKEDIEAGIYSHLEINIIDEKLHYDNEVLPNKYVGRYSKYNLLGREIRRKDLPKKPFSYTSEAPNYKGSGTHTVTHDIKARQREYWLPQNISVIISLMEEKQNSYIFKFQLNSVLSRDDNNFEKDLLYHINLLQENCGNINVFDAAINEEDYKKTLYVDWQLLPPGTSDIIYTLTKGIRKITPEIKNTIKERTEFFESLGLNTYIYGTNSFNYYFGAVLNNGIVLFENVRYGNAIYIFYENWEELSKMNRTELLNNANRNFVRIKHTLNWKNFVKGAIDRAVE